MYLYIYIYTYIQLHIYIYREREMYRDIHIHSSLRQQREAEGQIMYVRNLLGWLKTRLAQKTLTDISICYTSP